MLLRLIIPLLIIGCGRTPTDSSVSSDSISSRLLIVAMGGRNSCQKAAPYSPKTMSMYTEVQKALDKLSPHYSQTDILASCFRGDGQVFYTDSPDADVKKGDMRDIASILDSTQATVVVIGHSYGGWLAMQTLLHTRLKVSLFTIDPISPVNCAFLKPQNWLGCTKAPTDIPYDIVAQRTFEWYNYFQTSTRYLHSSEIPQARKNIYLRGSGHTTIDNNQAIWQAFVDNLKEINNSSAPTGYSLSN